MCASMLDERTEMNGESKIFQNSRIIAEWMWEFNVSNVHVKNASHNASFLKSTVFQLEKRLL